MSRIRWIVIYFIAPLLKVGENWPIWTGKDWKVFSCGKWVPAPKPPYIYDHPTRSFLKISQ